MASVHERRVGHESLGREPRERDGRRLFDERRPGGEPGGLQHLAPHVLVGGRLKRIDDDVRHVRQARRAEGFPDRQRGAAVRQPDFDHDAGPVRGEQVTQAVAVGGGQRNTLEVSFERPAAPGAAGVELRPGHADAA